MAFGDKTCSLTTQQKKIKKSKNQIKIKIHTRLFSIIARYSSLALRRSFGGMRLPTAGCNTQNGNQRRNKKVRETRKTGSNAERKGHKMACVQ